MDCYNNIPKKTCFVKNIYNFIIYQEKITVKKHLILYYFYVFIYEQTKGNLCLNQSSEIIQNMHKGMTFGLTSWTDKITFKN